MDFEQLKKGWQQQQKPHGLLLPEQQHTLLKSIRKVRRRYIINNIFITLSFAVTIGLLGFTWVSYTGGGLVFHACLAAMILLLLTKLSLDWIKIISWLKYDFTSNTKMFLDHLIKKLGATKWMRYRFTPIFTFLLWFFSFILFFYVFKLGKLLLSDTPIIIPALLLLWLIVAQALGMWRDRKREAETLDPLLKALKELREKLRE